MRVHDLVLRVFASALDQIEVALCVFDSEDHTLLWNETFLQFFPEHAGKIHAGEHYRENLRRFYSLRLDPDEMASLARYIEEGIQRHRSQQRPFEFDHHGYRIRVASLEIWRLGRIRVWRKTQPLPTVSEDQLAVQARRHAAGIDPHVALTLESLADGVLLVDAQERIVWANHAFLTLYGISSITSIAGLHFEALYAAAWAGREDAVAYGHSKVILREKQRFSGAPFEIALPYEKWVRIIELRGTRTDGYSYFSHVDITEFKRQNLALKLLSDRLENLALTDPLTGLANRRRFDQELGRQWRQAQAGRRGLSLLMIDVDDFKRINDSHGHDFGDKVLCALADVLRRATDAQAMVVARYGGEEFSVLLPGAGVACAGALAEDIRRDVEQGLQATQALDGLRVTVSIGVAGCSGAGRDGDGFSLVECADAALYQAKRSGRNRVCVGSF